jgi:hypothetical protein
MSSTIKPDADGGPTTPRTAADLVVPGGGVLRPSTGVPVASAVPAASPAPSGVPVADPAAAAGATVTATGAGAAAMAEAVQVDNAKLSIDVCILMDCTGSMAAWIEASKTTALSVARDLKARMPNALYRIGFVGYRDYADTPRFITVPFTEDVAAVQAALRPVAAMGGADEAEDVAGGLKEALAMDWRGDTRVLFHVADAPGHGKNLHAITVSDNHPSGDKFGLDPVAQMAEVAARGIDYYFSRINKTTDMMVEVFHAAWISRAAPDANFVLLDLPVQAQHMGDGGMSSSAAAREEAHGVVRPSGPPGARRAVHHAARGDMEKSMAKSAGSIFGSISRAFRKEAAGGEPVESAHDCDDDEAHGLSGALPLAPAPPTVMAMAMAMAAPSAAPSATGGAGAMVRASMSSAAPMTVEDAYSAGLMSSVMRSANTSVKRRAAGGATDA